LRRKRTRKVGTGRSDGGRRGIGGLWISRGRYRRTEGERVGWLGVYSEDGSVWDRKGDGVEAWRGLLVVGVV